MLQPFREYLYYMWSLLEKSLAIELGFDREEMEVFNGRKIIQHKLTSIRLEGLELLEYLQRSRHMMVL